MTPLWARMSVWLAAAAGISLTAGLGVWQMGRADQKQAARAELDARARAPAWTGSDWPCEGDPQALPRHQPARLQGAWLHPRSVLLDNRPMNGQVGFVLVTPLRVEAPAACRGRVILVQRGWLPRHAQDRTAVPPWPQPEGAVEVVGRLDTDVSRVYALGEEPMPGPTQPVIRQNAPSSFWAVWLGEPPRPGVLVQVQSELNDAASDPLRRQWPEPDLGVDKHHGYAAQWFGLSALLAGLTVWFQIIRPGRQHKVRNHDNAR